MSMTGFHDFPQFCADPLVLPCLERRDLVPMCVPKGGLVLAAAGSVRYKGLDRSRRHTRPDLGNTGDRAIYKRVRSRPPLLPA